MEMENNLITEEWIDGIVMMSPRPQYNHIVLNDLLNLKLKDYFKNKCQVIVEGALFLTKENPLELKKDLAKLRELVTGKRAELVPDIAVYCDREQIFKRGFLGIPQLVVEILSPSNFEKDVIKKKEIYEKYDVPEYWIVSPMSKKVYVYTIHNHSYKLMGEYNFLEEEIKSSRFEDLIININNVELLEDSEDY